MEDSPQHSPKPWDYPHRMDPEATRVYLQKEREKCKQLAAEEAKRQAQKQKQDPGELSDATVRMLLGWCPPAVDVSPQHSPLVCDCELCESPVVPP